MEEFMVKISWEFTQRASTSVLYRDAVSFQSPIALLPAVGDLVTTQSAPDQVMVCSQRHFMVTHRSLEVRILLDLPDPSH